MATRLPPNAFRLYTSATPAGHDLYPGKVGERVPRTQTGTWDRRVLTGPVSADAEALISSWSQDDYSGGFGIKDGNETTDGTRIAFGVVDARRPKSLCPPPLTQQGMSPSWAESGAFWPLGDVGTQFYGAWANGIAGWNVATNTWHVTQNMWPASFVPVNHAVEFCGYLYVPGGAQGLVRLSEATPSSGTLTVSAALTTLKAVALGLHDDKLWAIDTENKLWMLTPLGALAGGATLANWGDVTGTGVFAGTALTDAFDNAIYLPTGLTPTHLLSWFNPGQDLTLWCVTRGQGAYMFNRDEGRWIKAQIKAGAHPDWGLAADVFREGEDLMIAAGGLDVTRRTTSGVEVPLSGPSKDQGVPPQYQGTIVDLLSERSSLYALIQGGTSVAAGSPTSEWVLQQTVGNLGSGAGTFNNPRGVAVATDGSFWVADFVNKVVQRFTAAGVYVTSIPTTYNPISVCLDASGNLYVVETNSLGLSRVRKFNSALVEQWTYNDSNGSHAAACTDGTSLFVVGSMDSGAKSIRVINCLTGAVTATWGTTTGSGNGAFNSPRGIALDASHLYIGDTNNHRVQKLLKSDGSYVAQWGSLGSTSGQFTYPHGVALDASGDVWVADFSNSRLQRFSNAGVYQDAIAQSSPIGIGVGSGDVLYVSSGQNTVAVWDEENVTDPAIPAIAWLGAWTGTAWCALWETTAAIVPTWMRLSLKGEYALWWGDQSGVAYRQLLPPPFFNPAARVALGVYPFAPTGWLETVRYDANMSGWDKIASHFFAMMEYASADNYVDVSYRTDADQWTSGLSDPPYRPWKRIDHIGRTICWFDDARTDPISGLPWKEGEAFQWIQFRFDFVRGADIYKAPIWMWHSLHHLTVPQDSASFVLKVPLPQKPATAFGRSPDEMAETLMGLQTFRGMVHLQLRNPDPSHPEWQVFYRGRVTQVKLEQYLGADNNLAEVVVVNFVELEASSNAHTTTAVNTP